LQKKGMKRLILENKESITDQIQSYLEKSSESKFIHRLHVMLLFARTDDESCDSLGLLFGNSPRSVSNWIKKVNQTGDIESLRSIPQTGRPPRLTQEQKNEIRFALLQLPEKHGIHGKSWSGKNLSSFISQRYGIMLKIRSCQRLFLELGFRAGESPQYEIGEIAESIDLPQ
jgi:transposase